MADFTEAQISDIAEILGSNSDLMGTHLSLYASIITESDKTKVLAQITRYQNGTVVGKMWMEGNERNRGVNSSVPFSASTRDPREVISGLIQWPYVTSGARLVRA